MAGHGAAAPPTDAAAEFYARLMDDLGDTIHPDTHRTLCQLDEAALRGVARKLGERFLEKGRCSAFAITRMAWLVRLSDVAAHELFALDGLFERLVGRMDDRCVHPVPGDHDETCDLVCAFVVSSASRAAAIATNPAILRSVTRNKGIGSAMAIGALAAAGYANEVNAPDITEYLVDRLNCPWSCSALLCIAAELPEVRARVHRFASITVSINGEQWPLPDAVAASNTEKDLWYTRGDGLLSYAVLRTDAVAHLLVMMGGTNALRLFYACGGDISAAHYGTQTLITQLGDTPAHTASRCGYAASLEVLKELGADLSAKDVNGETVAEVTRNDAVRFVCMPGRRTKRAHDN